MSDLLLLLAIAQAVALVALYRRLQRAERVAVRTEQNLIKLAGAKQAIGEYVQAEPWK